MPQSVTYKTVRVWLHVDLVNVAENHEQVLHNTLSFLPHLVRRDIVIAGWRLWHDTIDTNLNGTANTVRAFAPHLVKRGAGRMILIASMQGRHGSKNASAYSASKWGIIGLMKSAALELGKYKITVNTIEPGLIDTPIYGEGPESEAFKAKLGESVLYPRRLGKPEELGSMVVELLTNSYMNAEVVRVDGGIRMPPK